jgi:ABC-type antimicrobial peptide transport system permease subunit
MALGAVRADIARLVFRQGGTWMLFGIVIGSAAAFGFAWLVRSFVFGAGAFNPVSMAAAAGIVAGACAVACILPALRATRVHPVEALRAE